MAAGFGRGGRPCINIPMLLDQFLKEYDIDPQQLHPRLHGVYTAIVGRMTEITGNFMPSFQDRTNNPKRLVACYVDWVRHVNQVVEDQWKPDWMAEQVFKQDVNWRRTMGGDRRVAGA